jgi:hypothetical protein
MQFSLLPKSPDTLQSAEPKRLEPETSAVLRGEKNLLERTYVSHFESSEEVHRIFCGKCGTHLTFHHTGPPQSKYEAWPPHFDIAVGSMDKECLEMEGFGPRRQGWYKDGIGWLQRLFRDGEEKFAG